jgi:hypothetical protein
VKKDLVLQLQVVKVKLVIKVRKVLQLVDLPVKDQKEKQVVERKDLRVVKDRKVLKDLPLTDVSKTTLRV